MKGYRTILTNLVVMALSGVEVVTGAELAVDDKTAVIAGALALLNIGYRLVTTTPVGAKK